MIKVLGLALYGPLAASTRYRLGQYGQGLASYGIDLRISSLLSDDYLRRRFSDGSFALTTIIRSGLSRLSDLWSQNQYDVLIVHCELLPFMPAWFERVLLRRPYVYDFDDAFYLKYRGTRFSTFSPFLSDKFSSVITGARAVTAGNLWLRQYALQFNSATHYLPTVVDTARYFSSGNKCNNKFTIGWIGSPSTAPYLSQLVKPLTILGSERALRLIVIGGKAPSISNVEVVEIGWTEHTEIDLINSFDVGVMPLPDDEWACGKCAFKLIQCMACAVPVVASAVGANIDVVTDECGILATTNEEWVVALRTLCDQPALRAAMGQAARERIVGHYSLHCNLPVLANVIREAGQNPKTKWT